MVSWRGLPSFFSLSVDFSHSLSRPELFLSDFLDQDGCLYETILFEVISRFQPYFCFGRFCDFESFWRLTHFRLSWSVCHKAIACALLHTKLLHRSIASIHAGRALGSPTSFSKCLNCFVINQPPRRHRSSLSDPIFHRASCLHSILFELVKVNLAHLSVLFIWYGDLACIQAIVKFKVST
jgi:hypothetical protein